MQWSDDLNSQHRKFAKRSEEHHFRDKRNVYFPVGNITTYTNTEKSWHGNLATMSDIQRQNESAQME